MDREKILWSKLPERTTAWEVLPYQKRVLEFDPVDLPNLFNPQPFQRRQFIQLEHVFKNPPGLCACGCDQPLTGRRIRWATAECQRFAVAVVYIVYGRSEFVARYMQLYYGWNCFKCGCGNKGHDMGLNGTVSWIKVDHIIPVKLGGGACWLSNYQLLCHDCHVLKTKKDFNWKI